MKKFILLIFLFIHVGCFASYGYRISTFSLLSGQQYQVNQLSLWTLSLQYDHLKKTCTSFSNYKGVGVYYNSRSDYSEIGIKGMINPTRIHFRFSRTSFFAPYLYGQVNYITKSKQVETPLSTYLTTPGIGLTGIITEIKTLQIRSNFQIGYQIPLESSISDPSLIFQVGIGIGLKSKLFSKNKSQE